MRLGYRLLLWRGGQTAHVSCGPADWKSQGKESSLVLEKALIASSTEGVSQGYFLLSLSRL